MLWSIHNSVSGLNLKYLVLSLTRTILSLTLPIRWRKLQQMWCVWCWALHVCRVVQVVTVVGRPALKVLYIHLSHEIVASVDHGQDLWHNGPSLESQQMPNSVLLGSTWQQEGIWCPRGYQYTGIQKILGPSHNDEGLWGGEKISRKGERVEKEKMKEKIKRTERCWKVGVQERRSGQAASQRKTNEGCAEGCL